MRNILLLVLSLMLFSGCGKDTDTKGLVVKNFDELKSAINEAKPGTEIVLANGVWTDAQIRFYGIGTENAPITLRAETPGEVFLEGQSYLHLGGEHLIVSGLYFRNGYSPKSGIIRYQIGEDSTAFNSRVTNTVIEGFTRPNRWEDDSWIEFYGKNNQLDHCYIAGKSNDGATLMVYHKGNQHTNSHHQIVNNYFGPRPRKGGPRAETMRLGGSETSMTPGRVNVANNYFEACNGEVEIISDKTNYNSFTDNIFYKCEGSLVMRHSNYTRVDGNIFIGGDDSDFYGGVRVVNTGHWITNNYFYKIRGEQFRSPLAIMNGIPKSAINRYQQVTDAVVAYNTWVDCKSPWQIGVGQNKASADVLPASEIRSAPPIRTTIANNLIYNTEIDENPVVNHDDMEGILFKNNLIDNNGSEYSEFDVLTNAEVQMTQINDWLYAPAGIQNEALNNVFNGYGFDKIKNGLFGASRKADNKVGAINQLSAAQGFKIDKTKYGPDWFTPNQTTSKAAIHTAASGELENVLSQANSGDIIELSDKTYTLSASLKIDKEITIRSAGEGKVHLLYNGSEGTSAFEMNPGGTIKLENISLKGQHNQLAFAPLAKNMASAYNLFVDDCVIENFDYVLKASKGSFADSIRFRNTTIQNSAHGFVLAADEKGDYNAEMVTFAQCEFRNIKGNVIHFYRGGYDESTIGGFLTVTNNTFIECGESAENAILIRTPGIINVRIVDNTFLNNPVDFIASLWGAKNNTHSGNVITESGEIRVEEQQKQELLY
ncbi:hypothetical protein LVD17_25325 [Fulvivirga ulvae]|uniref:chondroitinase-B domain-containing protein n=1 Tax=Fulvivirga ulvae TaxID=2904245 RepID=UPI001F2B720F|nr:chondroitinase-B domain-containing protein [Fulvivirga ulvae]UII31620.1 hypothetical protein LVD17_25325 [Fulvivirga ulvae]